MKKILYGLLLILCLSLVSASCYQETANVSTACGGLNTGTYSFTGTWINLDKTYDGSWTTVGYRSNSDGTLYINYTKPTDSTNYSLWQVKDSSGTVNLTILQSCFDYNPTQISLNVLSTYITGVVSWSCLNSSGWNTLRSISTSGFVYEEAMIWNSGEEYINESLNNSVPPEEVNSQLNISVLPDEFRVLPQVSSNVSLDLEGMERTYLFCSWRIDGIGEEGVLMNSSLCPAVQRNFTFVNSEDYVVFINYLKIRYNSSINDWQMFENGTSGSLHYRFISSYPEPSMIWVRGLWGNMWGWLKSIWCLIFGGSFCS